MTIRKRLLIRFAIILSIMGVLFLVTMFTMWSERNARTASNHALELSQSAELVRYQIMQNRVSLSNYLLSGSSDEASRLSDGMSALQTELADAEKKTPDGDQKKALQALSAQERKWGSEFASVMMDKRKQVDAGNATVADLQITYLQLDPAKWMKDSNQMVDQIESDTRKSLDKRKQDDANVALLSFIANFVFTLLGIGAGIGIAYFTAKQITEPLQHLIGVAREIAEKGDLSQEIDFQRDDEIGVLASAFRQMVAYLKEMAAVSDAIAEGNLSLEVTPRSHKDTLATSFSKMIMGLRTLVRNVRDAAAQVAAGSNQVADASEESAKISVQSASAIDEVTSTMHEMSVNVQNMVKNTQMQASSVSQTSASIDEMVTSIQRVADTAKVLLDISNRSREEVQNGIGTMTKTTDGLNRINGSIGSASDIIANLGQRADDIGKIIEVIDDISEQTNLLALNAAIEAARAGEHGLGFAVVADEVRKLAEKSAQSTKEISDLIQSIQKEARKAVENMEKSTQIVDEGLNLGNDLSTALRKISNVVTEVYKFAQEIGAATNEQSNGSTLIARATGRLNEITHEINSSVEEQAGGAQAVVRAMERMREMVQQSTSGSTELAASAEQMSKMARSLLESMDRFALDERRLDDARKLSGSKFVLAGAGQ